MLVEPKTKRTPSPQQQVILDEFLTGWRDVIVEAVAGSGKTSTLMMLFDNCPVGKTIAYGCYNSRNAEEAKEKVGFRPGIYIKTAHGFGRAAWVKAYPSMELDGEKKWDKIADFLNLRYYDPESKRMRYYHQPMAETVRDLISFAKDQVFGLLKDSSKIENWLEIVEHHSIEYNFAEDGKLPMNIQELILESCRLAFKGLKESIRLAENLIDFDDMIYMPLISNNRMWQYDYVFIDEAQDTNPARRELYKRMRKRGGRIFAVGDRHQAIYGFTGADSDALDLIRDQLNAISLPLSVSFRCSKAVVRVAQRYVKHIESSPTAPEGSERQITEDEFYRESLLPTDAVVCRNTAPLVNMAYTLLKRGTACHIEGKNIGEGLVKLTKQWIKVTTVGQFMNKLEDYLTRQIEKAEAKNDDAKVMVLVDKLETMTVLASTFPLDAPLSQLQKKIADLFSDSKDMKKQILTLMTIHKSKGLEFDRVFWFGANAYQPSPYARQEWQMEQEINLCYVAATRAKTDIIEVNATIKKRGFN